MKMVKIVGCAALLALLLLGVAAFAEEPSGYGYIVSGEPGKQAELREWPFDDAYLIGTFYDGVIYREDPFANQTGDMEEGWAKVWIEYRSENAQEAFGLVGYMRREDLVPHDKMGQPEPIASVNAVKEGVVRVPEGESGSPILRGHVGRHKVTGLAPDGAMVEVLGACDDAYYIRLGHVLGFMDQRHVTLTGDRTHWAIGPLPRGFAVIRDVAAGLRMSRLLPDPAMRSDFESFAFDPGYTHLMLSVADGYAQLAYAAIKGFVSEEAVAVFRFSDLFTGLDTALTDGTYASGKDFQPGVYTFFVEDGADASMRVTIGGKERAYVSRAETMFTTYLPEGAGVTFSGGTLRPASPESVFVKGKSERFAGNAKLMMSYDAFSTYTIRAGDGPEPSQYAVTSLLAEEYEAEPRVTGALRPGEAATVMLYPGEFIAFTNCVLIGEFGNG